MSDKIKNLKKRTLSKNWATLYQCSFDYRNRRGEWETLEREAYDRGNGSTVLLYNPSTSKIILTRQFRIPTFLNKNRDGMMIEACAGFLDENSAEACVKRETEEETGYRVEKVEKIFEAYMSPGSVTELLYFFIAEYSEEMRVSDGGGLQSEQEDIEVLELPFDQAYSMIETGEIQDGKTIMLLQYAKLRQLL